MRKNILIYSGLGLLALLAVYTYTFQSKVVDMPYFNSMLGNRNLTSTVPIEGTSVEKASLKKKSKTVVVGGGVTFSHFLSLETESKAIVAIASESKQFLLCPSGIENCITRYDTVTKQDGENKILMYGSFSRRRYIVELHKDVFIYRIQVENCFIGYPHGCLIHSFSWHDLYTYEFKR